MTGKGQAVEAPNENYIKDIACLDVLKNGNGNIGYWLFNDI